MRNLVVTLALSVTIMLAESYASAQSHSPVKPPIAKGPTTGALMTRLANMRGESIRSVTLGLTMGDTIWFLLSRGVVQDMTVSVGGTMRKVPLATCMPLRNVRFESVRFILGEHDTRKEGTFTILFRMGTDEDRRFDSLPKVQLNFYKWHFVDPLITTQTGPHSSFSSPPFAMACRKRFHPELPETATTSLRSKPQNIGRGTPPGYPGSRAADAL
jgi:hypothetical protein